jgi:hypothetical protein
MPCKIERERERGRERERERENKYDKLPTTADDERTFRSKMGFDGRAPRKRGRKIQLEDMGTNPENNV